MSWETVDGEAFVALLQKHELLFPEFLLHGEFSDLMDDEPEADFLVWQGDIQSDTTLVFPDAHVLVLGNVTAKVLWLSNEFVTTQVLGNVEVDHLASGHDQMTVIGGNLKVNEILNLTYSDAELLVKGDVTAKFIAGSNVICGGTARFEYGNSCAVGFDGSQVKAKPAHDLHESSLYIGAELEGIQNLKELLRSLIGV